MVVHEGASITCANRTARREYNDDLSQVTTCELAFRFDGGIGCWDEEHPQEWRTVAKKAIAEKRKVHVGRVFD